MIFQIMLLSIELLTSIIRQTKEIFLFQRLSLIVFIFEIMHLMAINLIGHHIIKKPIIIYQIVENKYI